MGAEHSGLAHERQHGEGIMYPIERTDYINAYIGAISEEMRDARLGRRKPTGQSGSLDRFSSAIARFLRTGSQGSASTGDPQPAA